MHTSLTARGEKLVVWQQMHLLSDASRYLWPVMLIFKNQNNNHKATKKTDRSVNQLKNLFHSCDHVPWCPCPRQTCLRAECNICSSNWSRLAFNLKSKWNILPQQNLLFFHFQLDYVSWLFFFIFYSCQQIILLAKTMSHFHFKNI